jgi:hypothetical protein
MSEKSAKPDSALRSATQSTSREPIRLSTLQNEPCNGTGNGLACRKCGCRHFKVVYTRPAPGAIRRLRECRNCGRRVVTTERC